MVKYVVSDLGSHWSVSRLAEEATVQVSDVPTEAEALGIAHARAKDEPGGARIIRVLRSGDSNVVEEVDRAR